MSNPYKTLQQFKFGNKTGKYHSLPALEKAGLGKISRLPVSLRVVLESALRNFDGKKITDPDKLERLERQLQAVLDRPAGVPS